MQSEFDDHIKKQVDGFKLSPSAQVWDLVEAQLPEKKRRRFIFWWLPLGIILIGFGIYELVGNNKKNNVINDNKIAAEINKTRKNDLISDSTKINNPNRITESQNRELDKTIVKFSKKNTSNKVALNKIVSNYNGVNKSGINIKNYRDEVILKNGTDLKNSDKLFNRNSTLNNNVSKESVTLDKTNLIVKDEIKNDKINTTKKGNITVNGNLDNQAIKKISDSTTINLAEKKTENIKNDTSLNNTKKAVKTNLEKVKWELITVIGKANTIENNSNNNSSSQYSSSPNSGTITTPGNTLTQASLSAPTSGFSFGINLQRTQQITKQLSWYGSVGYRYLSNHQASGTLVDSSKIIGGDSAQFYTGNNSRIDKVSSYYKYGNSLNHTNYIHLFNVLFGLKYNISKSFSINAGFGFGYQFSSKWLQPDINKGVLYYSNKLTNKWNMGTNIGFNWQFAKPFSLGVFYNYSFSRASLAAVQQNLHWQSFGAIISVQLPFKK